MDRSTKTFQELLRVYSQLSESDSRKEMEARIWKQYGVECAVFVLDMSGFSLLSRKYGIIHYLSMVSRMQIASAPVLKQHEGRVIKFEADNCFAVFPDALQAVRASVELQLTFRELNRHTPDEFDIGIACGISYGRILIPGNSECFGDAVNLACKLGEDLGEAGDILVTSEAMARIPADSGIRYEEITLSISGLVFPACSVSYECQSGAVMGESGVG